MRRYSILFITLFVVMLNGCMQQSGDTVEPKDSTQYQTQEEYIAEMQAKEEKLSVQKDNQGGKASVVKPEQLEKNIKLAYLIYSTRDPRLNKSVPIYVSDYTTANKDGLWESYLLPEELENFALSVNIEGSEEYMVGIIKPIESYKLNVYESLKLLKSGYIGSLSDSHSLKVSGVYMAQVKDYIIYCICPNADKVGAALKESLLEADL